MTIRTAASLSSPAKSLQPGSGAGQPMSAGQWGILLALSVLWGASFYFYSIGLTGFPPFTLVLARTALASVILFAVILLTGETLPLNRRSVMAMIVLGLFNNTAPFTLLAWGQSHIGTGPASILNATTPLWTVIFAHFFTSDEKITVNRLAGVIFGICGVAMLIGTSAFDLLGSGFLGQLACIGAALSYALATVCGRRFRPLGLTPLATATGQSVAATALLLPLSLLIDQPWTLPEPGLPAWLAVLGLATLSTALAYLLFFRLLATAGATNIQLVTFLVPVTAILLGVFLLGERFDPHDLGGMALIGCGLSLIDGRLPRRIVSLIRRP